MSACVDEIPGYGYDIPEGEVTVDLETAFTPFTESILSRSTTIPGKAMEDLSDLCILAYGTDGKLIKDYFNNGVLNVSFNPSEVDEENRTNADASNGTSAEASTKCLKKTLTLPTGRYYLIAVANLGSYTRDSKTNAVTKVKSTWDALTDPSGEYYGKYETLDELRRMTVSWDLDNDADNREMLGYFTDSKENVPSSGSQFSTIVIRSAGQKLHTWLRRCASKVTIDFDGSELRENVRVYLKEARIYDIPKTCTLGFGRGSNASVSYNNAAGKENGIYTASDVKLTNAIIYGEGTDHNQWPAVTKGTPYGAYIKSNIDDDDNSDTRSKEFGYQALHSEAADALFFYENMQGDAPRDKFQIADLENGGVQGTDDKKDGMEYGTYIEVVGHYYSTATGAVSEGDIKYRFMLGKDVKRNCDAERNYHYKLTLKLRGNANDYDWHIDYKDTKPFDIPNPWYVSYLYNHDAVLPFKFIPKDGYKIDSVVAKIIENPWYPANGETPDGENKAPYINTLNKDNGNGFLSLRETDNVVVTTKMAGATEAEETSFIKSFPYGDSKYATFNHAYYKGEAPSLSTIDRSQRTYYFNEHKDPTNKGREEYTYQRDGGKYNINIPLFTRAKVLIKQTGYSGNNPYVGYERHAKLSITVYTSDDKGNTDESTDTTTVVQVRRIVNPKGVYRRAGNNQDFNVTLMRLPGDDKDMFEEFRSDGPWMAEIIGDKNFITLDGKQVVTGATQTPIKFQIRFNKLNNKNTPTKNAVVRVRYHNYTCTHLIFVRQGYKPQALSEYGTHLVGEAAVGGQKATVWSTFNRVSIKQLAEDPRDEGSMFKFGDAWHAIDAVSNVYTDDDGKAIVGFPADSKFKTPPPIYLTNGDGSLPKNPTPWADLSKNSEGFINDRDMNVATARDFEQLYLTPNIQFGYGVLYADGATITQQDVESAYGWYRRDNDNTKGMRGMFAYYWDRNNPDDSYNARNVFFPIGRSGYGHRKAQRNGKVDGVTVINEVAGTLRYSCSRYEYAPLFESVAPLFCNLYRRPGAIYWAKNITSPYLDWSGTIDKKYKFYALDINYFTFDVNAIVDSNIANGDDACFVRGVE